MVSSGAQNFSDMFFGRIAVKNGLATDDQVSEALKVQAAEGEHPRSLGEILKEKGWLTDDQVRQVLAAQARSETLLADSLLGRLAVKNNLVTEDELLDALQTQKDERYRRPIGKILLERRKITPHQLSSLLKAQKRVRRK